MKKIAMSQATWACMSGLVQDARIESHRIHQLLGKVLSAIESLPQEQKEVAYQIAGDMIQNIPDRIDNLENKLDVLSYALSIFGKDHMRERLSIADRTLVESALESAPDLRIRKEAKMKKTILKLAKEDSTFRKTLISSLENKWKVRLSGADVFVKANGEVIPTIQIIGGDSKLRIPLAKEIQQLLNSKRYLI